METAAEVMDRAFGIRAEARMATRDGFWQWRISKEALALLIRDRIKQAKNEAESSRFYRMAAVAQANQAEIAILEATLDMDQVPPGTRLMGNLVRIDPEMTGVEIGWERVGSSKIEADLQWEYGDGSR